MTSIPEGTAAPVGPVPATHSFQRIAGVFFTPVSTFRDIARKPDVLVPLIVMIVLSIITTIVLVPRLDFEATIRDEIEKNPNISASDTERIVRFGVASAKVIAYASPLISIATFAVIAGVLLLAFRLFGGEGTFRQAFSATIYAWFPAMVKGLILVGLVAARGTVTAEEVGTLVRSNPAFLVDLHSQPVLFAALSSLDVFTIWTIILFVIGFSALSGFSKAKSAAIVVSLWLVTLLFRLGLAAMAAARAVRT